MSERLYNQSSPVEYSQLDPIHRQTQEEVLNQFADTAFGEEL